LFWSALFVAEIMCWVFSLDKLICSFVLVLTRAWTVRYALFAFGTEDMGLSIVAKLSTVIVGSRSVAGVSF
jgi:hypothetical protein